MIYAKMIKNDWDVFKIKCTFDDQIKIRKEHLRWIFF